MPTTRDRRRRPSSRRASTSGRALENADLVEEITRRAEAEQALVRRLAVLDELSRLGASVASADELADRSARLVGRALGASGTGYGLFAADGSGYDTSTTVGVRQPLAEWLAGAVPAERRAIRRGAPAMAASSSGSSRTW